MGLIKTLLTIGIVQALMGNGEEFVKIIYKISFLVLSLFALLLAWILYGPLGFFAALTGISILSKLLNRTFDSENTNTNGSNDKSQSEPQPIFK